jgi:hypothetical protein
MNCGGKSRDDILRELEGYVNELGKEDRERLQNDIDHLVNEHGLSRLEAILYFIATGVAIVYNTSNLEKEAGFYAQQFGTTKISH